MDKEFVPFIPKQSFARSSSRHSFLRYLTLVSVSLLVLYNAYRWTSTPNHEPRKTGLRKDEGFAWPKLKPSTSLDWYSCYEDYQCARLDVPLDWSASVEHQSRKRAAVAVVRLPAKVPITSRKYGGAILINPGGPGGSGVNMLLGAGKRLQQVVDTGSYEPLSNNTGLHFDIIGFDPRGVNHTTPSPSCFPDDASREFWSVSREAQGSLAANGTFPLVWSRNKALADSCSSKLANDWDGIGKYMNTPQVAADMVAIIEALGEWKEDKAKEAIREMQCHRQQAQEVEARTKWNKGNEKLLYWGFSYGTLLGATFANLYPGKVGRVTLDGVCDADDYYSGTWLSNLQDSDMIIGSFFRQCDEAGPLKCPLWSAEGVEGIRAKYHNVLRKLESDPLSVSAHGRYAPDIITLSDAMNEVREAVYSPMAWFKHLASTFDALSKGNGSELAAMKQDRRISYCRNPTCTDNPYSDSCYSHVGGHFKTELSAAILCTDGPADQLKWQSKDHFAKWQALRKQSHSLGDYWAEITMFCANWNIRPAWNFTYPDIANPNTTSHPILFASTTRDPVTPLENAQKMQRKFKGAGLLVSEGDGHCTLSAPSLCAAKSIRNYFQTGELPPEGLVCIPEKWPLDDDGDIITLGDDVRELVKTMDELSNGVRRSNNMPLGIW